MSLVSSPVVDDFYQRLLRDLEAAPVLSVAGATSSSAKTFLLAGLLSNVSMPVLWVSDDDDALVHAAADLRSFGVRQVYALTGEDEKDPIGKRRKLLTALSRIVSGQNVALLVTQEFLEDAKLPLAHEMERSALTFTTGDHFSLTQAFNRLIDMGYEASETALIQPGTYFKRGGIIDLFPVNADTPVRIELWGDEIETIQSFDPGTQRILGDLPTVTLYPLALSEARGKIQDYAKHAIVVADELGEAAAKALGGRRTIAFVPFSEEADTSSALALDFSSVLRFHTPLEFTKELQERLRSDPQWRVAIYTLDQEKVWNLLVEQQFTDGELAQITLFSAATAADDQTVGSPGTMHLRSMVTSFPEAFLSQKLKTLLVTEREIFGNFEVSRTSANAQVDAAFLATLAPGDLVVHLEHGIAIFRGIEQKTVGGVTREYLHLEYAKGDRLFVPVEQADKVNKYIGATGDNAPTLTRLGSAEWSLVTRKARKETLEIAKELLELYALREASEGFAFKPDDEEQKRFEADFPYTETPGQTKTLEEVKADMEKKRPMDRLVCGDVGYGKTEIAMRAAFKAVRSGKQVAYLAPITILVDQQYKSFQKRLANFPDVKVAMLSRFATTGEQNAVLRELAAGTVHIVIGTHRLLQPDVKFQDLGLVIIDEEQRFGVKQKETLKKMRANVDLLTLTATPVPRTLNMALSGIRDISTITTPPPGRLPVATEVRRFSLPFIHDVIKRELDRKGQVYFLHNRVQTIESTAEKLRELIPGGRFVVAHGQLPPDELEKRIMAFKEHEYDVLVSSTIIENGIDLPNANTLVVDRAERLGLAQAYQLRGRVGRSRIQAYAYFLYHSQKLDETAKKRLKAIVEASELGSGFQIAMRDLEIRGAGDILGAKQHGTINAIGVTHFTRLLKTAVDNMKAGRKEEELLEKPPLEASVELNVNAYIPELYIPKESEKLKFYQRLAAANNLESLHRLKAEIGTEFGTLPPETKNLFEVLELKLRASEACISHVKETTSGRQELIELCLTKDAKPQAVMNLLGTHPKWMVSGTSLKIAKDDLGPEWFYDLKDHIELLKVPEGKESLPPAQKPLLVSGERQ